MHIHIDASQGKFHMEVPNKVAEAYAKLYESMGPSIVFLLEHIKANITKLINKKLEEEIGLSNEKPTSPDDIKKDHKDLINTFDMPLYEAIKSLHLEENRGLWWWVDPYTKAVRNTGFTCLSNALRVVTHSVISKP